MRFIGKTVKALTAGGFVALLVMMVWGTADVVAQVFGYSLPATVAWTEILSVIALTLPLAYATSQKAHISVDLLTQRLTKRRGRFVNLASLILAFLFSTFLAWQLSLQAWQSVRIWEYDLVTIRIYWFPAKISLAIGYIGTAVVTLFHIIGALRQEQS